MSGIPALHEALKKEFQAPNVDAQKCNVILAQIKTALAQTGFFVQSSKPGSPLPDTKDLLVIRDILEMGALCSIRAKDIPAFERYFSQLNTYYTDYSALLPLSPRTFSLLGLNLLRLLAQNRISEFHTALELIDSEKLFSDPYIKHAVHLEQCLMEGSYNKVWNARSDVPAPEYQIFMDILMQTIRAEIATSLEIAYEGISLTGAANLLFFKEQSEVQKFVQQRGWNLTPANNLIIFGKHPASPIEGKVPAINNEQVMMQTLHYAREMEKIV